MRNQDQIVTFFDATGVRRLRLPPPADEILPGVRWGEADRLFTPAFWSATAWLRQKTHHPSTSEAWGLRNEVAACLLGGYGITYELSRAAFDALASSGVLDSPWVDAAAIEHVLRQPLRIGTTVSRYRFPRLKAIHLAGALNNLQHGVASAAGDLDLRNQLLKLPGVGLKTASWIVRNYRTSDEVAIIDIHVYRAGLIMGLFDPAKELSRDYLKLEQKFLAFATAIAVKPSALDILIWEEMRSSRQLALEASEKRLTKHSAKLSLLGNHGRIKRRL